MGKTLTEIAQEIKESSKKVQLIYAFNGVGKTRLSQEFKRMVSPKFLAESKLRKAEEDLSRLEEKEELQYIEKMRRIENEIENLQKEFDSALPTRNKMLYYNAFTEDLFYWDNDLLHNTNPILKIQPNSFIKWIIGEQGRERDIYEYFQYYTKQKISPKFSSDLTEVSFSYASGDRNYEKIKISKGEERNFIWSVFYTLISSVFYDIKEQGDKSDFFELEYIFIDDPVSSLDDNYLINLAVDLSNLIKNNLDENSKIKFIITTHSPLFYNVLFYELNRDDENYKKKYCSCSLLEIQEDGFYDINNSKNSTFSYHLFIRKEIIKAIKENNLKKYHLNLIRNLLEKISTFLGYKNWGALLPEDSDYEKRILNLYSHSRHSGDEFFMLEENEKKKIKEIMDYIDSKFHFYKDGQ